MVTVAGSVERPPSGRRSSRNSSALRGRLGGQFPCRSGPYRPQAPSGQGAQRGLLPLVGDEEELGALLGLELRGPVLTAEVVADLQRVVSEFVDRRNRLPLVG